MIRADQIPPEVVEAAAKAICELTGNHPRWMYWMPEARTAIVAALNAWPGMVDCGDDWIDLPLMQERTDD